MCMTARKSATTTIVMGVALKAHSLAIVYSLTHMLIHLFVHHRVGTKVASLNDRLTENDCSMRIIYGHVNIIMSKSVCTGKKYELYMSKEAFVRYSRLNVSMRCITLAHYTFDSTFFCGYNFNVSPCRLRILFLRRRRHHYIIPQAHSLAVLFIRPRNDMAGAHTYSLTVRFELWQHL